VKRATVQRRADEYAFATGKPGSIACSSNRAGAEQHFGQRRKDDMEELRDGLCRHRTFDCDAGRDVGVGVLYIVELQHLRVDDHQQ
jgi:hypothetical protein